MKSEDVKRFLKKVEVRRRRCWLWKASTRNGYGQFFYEGRLTPAHRVAYAQWVGPIPRGHIVHHRCKNPACVNPQHLVAVTYREHAYLDTPPKQRVTPRGEAS